ncbi:Fibrillin-3 [Geodia barretti]|uniref:Fibrillin-3 n=1 Tax=Geodia barretti TaxID=519541 RepID=A0AA35T6L8_GEOBA|nr:Fibrillin-3 [Geodia barretti]
MDRWRQLHRSRYGNISYYSNSNRQRAQLHLYVDINIDECATDMDNCAEHATCTDIEGSYSCNCDIGYTGDGTECIDVNECELQVDSCDENANCTNIDGGHNCSCLPGYSGNGTYCYDIDECTTDMDNCAQKATCTNTDGSFSCMCSDGYTGYGVVCYDIDECENNSDSCDVNADCNNTNGSFSCSCKRGYSGNGATCTDMDECLGEVSNDCSAAADCLNTAGSYSCHCKPGYGTNCSDVDECSGRSHDCSKNAECLNIEGGYNCQCSTGYTGNGKVCEALPDVRGPEEQKTGENGSNLGLISGVTVAGFLVVATLLIIGFLCALKIRKHSKSMKVPLSINVAFGKPNHNLPALSESTKQTRLTLLQRQIQKKTCTKVSV